MRHNERILVVIGLTIAFTVAILTIISGGAL